MAGNGEEWVRTHCRECVQAQIVNPDSHEAEYHMALAQQLGYAGEMPAPFVSIEPFDDSIFNICEFKNDFIILSDTTVNQEWERKRWPYYPELAHLLAIDEQIILVGSAKEKESIDLSLYPASTITAFDLSLPQSAYLISQCKYFVGNDSGPTHIAAALGVPTFALFGATRIKKNRPIGRHVRIIKLDLPCSPCQYEGWWNTCSEYECMTFLMPSRVALSIHNYLMKNCGLRIADWGLEERFFNSEIRNPKSEILPSDNFHIKLEELRNADCGIEESEIRNPQFPRIRNSSDLIHLIPQKQESLAIVMRIKDALPTIRESLVSAARIADKILICDNGSTDGTQAIYEELNKAWHYEAFHHSRGIVRIEHTEGLDEARDRRIMNQMLKESGCTWGMMLDADEIIEGKITRQQVEAWMNQWEHAAILFRHVHFWGDKNHYRIDQRWKPKHNRLMWRMTPESHILSDRRTNPGIVQNLKGRTLETDFVVKHYGHIDQARNEARKRLWQSIDNPSHKDWTGMDYSHMTDETMLRLTNWRDDDASHEWGNDSLLLILMHGGGDVLMATPTIEALKVGNPNLEISVMGLGVTGERDFKTREIFENNPHITATYDSSIDHHPTWWSEEQFNEIDVPIIQEDLRRITQLTRFDQVLYITLQGNRHLHRIDRVAADFGLTLPHKQMRVYPTGSDRRWASRFLSQINLTHGTRLASVHRFCGHPPKSWNYEACETVCQRLVENGWTVILWDQDLREVEHEPRQVKNCGMQIAECGIEESEIPNPQFPKVRNPKSEILQGSSNPQSAIRNPQFPIGGVYNMRDYGEALTVCKTAALLEVCDIHIGADSFPMHLASACGIPTIGIFEKTIPGETVPLNANSVAIATRAGINASAPNVIEREMGRIVLVDEAPIGADVVIPVIEKLLSVKLGARAENEVSELLLDGFPPILAPTAEHEKIRANWESSSEKQVRKYLERYANPDWTFLDIGAHIGQYSQLTKDWFDTSISIEANLDLNPLFRLNVPDNTGFRRFALSDEASTQCLTSVSGDSARSIVSKDRWFLSAPIETTPLDNLNFSPEIIKIDVGSDPAPVIRGGIETLKKASVVIVENGNPAFVRALGFQTQQIGEHHILGVRSPLGVPGFPVNGPYDPGELELVKDSLPDMVSLAEIFPELHHNPLKWFEYSKFFELDKLEGFKAVLDLGSGLSVLPFYLAMQDREIVLSIDPDETQNQIRNLAAQDDRFTGKNLVIQGGTIFDLHPQTFDAVLFISIIEHVENDTETALEAIKFVKPGGVLAISTDFYHSYIEYPDANRKIVTDRTGHSDSRIYDKVSIYERLINPLLAAGMTLVGDTDFETINMRDPYYLPVRGLYGFARLFFRRT